MDYKISVVIRTYNEEKHIGEVLKSLNKQTYSNFEVIILDSQSTDNTIKIAQNYDVRIEQIEKKEFNYSFASNKCVEYATQTPHSYRFDELWTVHNQAIEDGVINMAASCLLMQKYGYTTYFSKGSEKNIKITTVEDIEIFKALLSAKNDEWIKK